MRAARAACAALVLLATSVVPAAPLRADVPTSVPLRLHAGWPRGAATARHVSSARTRRAEALPQPGAARVLWHRQLPGGIGGNVLVDAGGKLFVSGSERWTQLSPDGSVERTERLRGRSPIALALLSDGSRALLGEAGHVLGWSERGSLAFELRLDAPPSSAGGLLGVASGGLLASAGPWLFEVDATRQLRRRQRLPANVDHLLVVAERAIGIDARGRVFVLDDGDEVRLAAELEAPVLAALGDAEHLMALTARRSLERIELASGDRRSLARFDAPGVAPLLALPAPGRVAVMRIDGGWLVLQADAATLDASALPPPSPRGPVGQLDFLVDASETVAWWGANIALQLEQAPGAGVELGEVRCSAPAGLAPAGPSRLVAACRSGAIWLIGPAPAAD